MESVIEKLQAYTENFKKDSEELVDYVCSHEDWIFAFFDYYLVREHIGNGYTAMLEYVESFDENSICFCISFKNKYGDEDDGTVFLSVENLIHISDKISKHKGEYSGFLITEKIKQKQKELDSLRLIEKEKEKEIACLERQLRISRIRDADSEK